MTERDPRFVEAEAMLHDLVPLFAGTDPDVVGSVLGQLVAIFIAGHNPAIRAEVQAAFVTMVSDLVDLMDTRPDSPWPRPTRQ